ncbi:HRDC domain-containing protein [Methanocella sp. MCL-LM]|uniref:HRDC domain-containing protein n=1 Tax=Methanocella sp. MCL-LM TaxID=3412035 RepID=UPI003C706EB7
MMDDTQFKVLLNMKDILMRMGINVPMEEIEADLQKIADCDEHGISPAMYELITRYLEKYGSDRYENQDERKDIIGTLSAIRSCMMAGCFCLGEGLASIEYTGRATKARKGEYIILVKPDNSVIVHGPSGIAPICYMNRAAEIKPYDCQGKIGLMATGKNERLSIVFEKMISFQGLFTPLPEKREPVSPDLTEEEQQLEESLKTLRKTLASENGIKYLPAIYDNRMLSELVRRKPASIEELGQIKGFGEKRMEKYGTRVLDAIAGFTTCACP